jgi:hypothetical protein
MLCHGTVFTAETLGTPRNSFFSLSAERPESEKQQPFGHDNMDGKS